jgi:hypothetical protein
LLGILVRQQELKREEFDFIDIFLNFNQNIKLNIMKKLIVLFSAVLAFSAGNAQEAVITTTTTAQPDVASARAVDMTNKMAAVITDMTADQKTKVQAINLETIKLDLLNNQKAKDDPNQMAAERKRIQAKWEQDMNGVLKPEQMAKWKAAKDAK